MARLYGVLDNDRRAQITRTSHKTIDSMLKTNETKVSTYLNGDGSGHITITRGSESVRLDWYAESTVVKGTDGKPTITPGKLTPELYRGEQLEARIEDSRSDYQISLEQTES